MGPMGQGPWARAHGPRPMGQGPWAKAHVPRPMGRAQSLRFRGPGRARAQPAEKFQKNRLFGENGSEFGTCFSSVEIFF